MVFLVAIIGTVRLVFSILSGMRKLFPFVRLVVTGIVKMVSGSNFSMVVFFIFIIRFLDWCDLFGWVVRFIKWNNFSCVTSGIFLIEMVNYALYSHVFVNL